MTATDYSLEPVDALSPAALAGLEDIYEEGFPPHERDDFAAVTSQRQPGELSLALVSGGRPSGFAMLRPLGDTGWVYLRYLVVDGSQRGQGLGGLLWDKLTAWLREAGFTLLVFDVEDPDEPGCDSDQVSERLRRIRFYEKQQASLLPVTGYQAPHVAPGDSGWMAMRLMTAPLDGRPAGPDAGRARDIVDAVYRFRWQLEPGQRPVIGFQS
jgi:GNAT superfamily N-acetyltransferase